MTFPWSSAWVTGASSGIGKALALELATAGVQVTASARRREELAILAASQPGIAPLPIDVTDAAAMVRAAAIIEATSGPIELAIFNAGVGPLMALDTFDPAVAAGAMAVNYQGLVNGIAAVLPGMRARARGHIALMSSLAGYRGLPRGAAYSPSKAAAISLAECLKPEFDAAGLRISIINPGFIATPMTARAKSPLPFLMTAQTASRIILRRLAQGRFEIAFPWQMAALVRLGQLLPYSWYFRLMPNTDQQ